MITSNGTIKISTKMDENMQKELSHKSFIFALVFTILGAIGVAAYIVLEVVSVFIELKGGFFEILIVFAIFLGCGIALLILLNKAASLARNSHKVNVYEFFSGYFILSELLNGETVATVKIYNNQIIKSKETKNYFFFYVNSAAAYPVAKQQLSAAELNTLRLIFKLPAEGETVNLSTAAPAAQSGERGVAKSFLPPEEPFDEFNKKD
ncbi:MAG: YcxB family protein [Clostridia bacterium]|nr:YcxB family protein [Clostridia bacterium]